MIAVAVVAAAFSLWSPDVARGGRLPRATVWDRDGCTGANRSPALRWSAPPRGTRSFALSLFDPDAGRNGWWHWVAIDIAPTRNGFGGGVMPLAGGIVQGVNDFGTLGYGGPCPPPGPRHRYVFTLYALDVTRLRVRGRLDGARFRSALAHHVVGRAEFIAVYKR